MKNFDPFLNLPDGNPNAITNWLVAHEADILETADYIFNHPELAYQEKLSSKCLAVFWKRTVSRLNGQQPK
ncbi:MAG: hypothetical protein V8S08_10800 [Lachnoclostridium sp.]